MTDDPAMRGSSSIATQLHRQCFVCGPANQGGLRLSFLVMDDGSVQTEFDCGGRFGGYPGMLHGGVVSSLLDGAMTNCLFAHGREGLTGEITVRFRHPVIVNRHAVVRAWIDRSAPPYHLLRAELVQDECIKAKATGKFVERHPGEDEMEEKP